MNQLKAKRNLLGLLTNVQIWGQLEKKITQLPTKKERGDCFELFVKSFLILSPEYHLNNVWLLGEAPSIYIKRLGQHRGRDIGIDIIGTNDEEKVWAIQAKFRSNRKEKITYRELSTALASSDRADYRLIVTNTERLPNVIRDRTNVGQILIDRLDLLEKEFYQRISEFLKSSVIETPKKKKPREYQDKIITKSIKFLNDNDRGKVILPPATGKTLIGLWIYEALGVNNVLVMIPSLALLRQTLEEWSRNAKNKFHYICIGSDITVVQGGVDEDIAVGYRWELDIPVTTESDELKKFILDDSKKPKVIFATYQSSRVIIDAVKESFFQFDLAIYDEAHRTAQIGNSLFNLTLSDSNLLVKKRLFFTATPKLYADNIKTRAEHQESTIFSMDDKNIYGDEIYRMNFKEAIKLKCLTDYKIAVIMITNDEIRGLIKSDELVHLEGKNDTNYELIQILANKIALLKAFNKFGAKHFFSFHSRIKNAKKFIEENNYGLIKNFSNIVSKAKNELFVSHVNGGMTTAERENILNEFKQSEYGLISNARCLSEGVNIPAVDGVYFVDPKYSKIDIIQSVGRALRIYKNKKYGYIVVPVFLQPDEFDKIDIVVNQTKFAAVWNVIAVMQSQDQGLDELLTKARIQKAEITSLMNNTSRELNDTLKKLEEKIEVVDIPKYIDKELFITNLHLHIVDRRTSNWYFMYGLLKSYNLFNARPWPKANAVYEGYKIGAWCTRQRFLKRKFKLDSEKIYLLKKINFDFGKKRSFRRKKKRKSKTTNIKIGISNFRNPYIISLFDKYRYKISYKWINYYALLFYYRKKHPNSWPAESETYNDLNLFGWSKKQRFLRNKEKLTNLQIDLLNNLGFVWGEKIEEKNSFGSDSQMTNWANEKIKTLLGFEEESYKKTLNTNLDQLINSNLPRAREFVYYYPLLKEFRRENPDNWPNKKEKYKGTELGKWLFNVYKAKKKDSLLPLEKILLDEIGFNWDKNMVYNKETIKLLQKYRKNNPNSWPEKNEKYMGYNLYDWCLLICYEKRKGRLDKEIEKILNTISFPWNQYKM